MQGWIKDYRKELESDVWMMSPLYHRVWQYLKYDVNHKAKTIPTKYGKLELNKGQTVTSYQKISKEVAWYEWGIEKAPNKKTIKSILDWLEYSGMIKRESNAKGTLITVCNYCDYQGSENGESNSEETQKKRSLDTNKNGKNGKNEKETIYVEIISYLNEKAGKNFSHKTKVTQETINARLSEGYTLEDFKQVIDNKVKGWTGTKNSSGEPMENYLRPNTLFAPSKFEGYLNERVKPKEAPYAGGPLIPAAEIAEARRKRQEEG